MDASEAKRRRGHVDDPHVAPLNSLVRGWRTGPGSQCRFVPWFDPAGPGTAATVLLLLEAPGPATIARGDHGFSSLDNADPTTQTLRRALDRSGLPSSCCLRWNAVPWALVDQDGRRRTPRTADLEDARPALTQLLLALRNARVVVPLGSAALEAWMRHLTLSEDVRVLPTLAVPHPSPANAHRRREAFERTVQALQLARRLST